MGAIKVSIQEFKEKTNEYLKIYSEYMHKLAKINIAEKAEINSIQCDEKDKFDEYCKQFPEHVEKYKKQRKDLKEEYGDYSSYYNCPYYCLVTNTKELYELFKERLEAGDEDLKSENSIYNYNKRTMKKFVGKKVQNEYGKDIYGKCIGVAFFIDQDYWCVLDEKTDREEFCMHIQPFNIWDHRCWRIVENGKDYL